MSKSNSIVRFFKNINIFINKLLEKNLNILNRNNLINILKSNKIFVTCIALLILFLSYLSIPNIYNQTDVLKELKSELSDKFNLNLRFSNELEYKFFPRPHFTSKETEIINDESEISKIKNLKIFISLKNLFPLKKINAYDVVLEGANFNLNIENYNFFIKLLNNNFSNTSLNIINSNIFFRNIEREVLFIKKILKMKYYYNKKELKNIVHSENELFNIPFSIELIDDRENKKINSKFNVNIFRLKIENQYFYGDEAKKGLANLIFKNIKSTIRYQKSQNYFEFNYFDKKDNQNFLYNGELFFKPFHSYIKGYTNELNLLHLFKSNSFISQILKTELLNEKNLNLKLKINAEKILNNNSFVNILLNSKIQEGFIDIDNTSFKWKNYANFNLFNSLIYIDDGELILDANSQINIIDNNGIYKFLMTPKSYRKILKKINFNFSYNFDKKIINISDLRIDDKSNQKVSKILKNISIKNEVLQNKIYFKNLLNTALKNHAG